MRRIKDIGHAIFLPPICVKDHADALDQVVFIDEDALIDIERVPRSSVIRVVVKKGLDNTIPYLAFCFCFYKPMPQFGKFNIRIKIKDIA